MNLQGILTALVTPFRGGRIDEEALKALIEFQLREGIDGIVPCGTTGEASTLSYEEHERVMALTVQFVKGAVPVIAGTGSNSTEEAVELTMNAKKCGVDMCLLTTPYYNRPTQEGLYLHYKKIAEEVDIPLVLYNIPGRTGVNMLPETVARLAGIPNIVAIKEASGSLGQVTDIWRLTQGKFVILSGDDNLFLPMMSAGAQGVISVLSNIAPRPLKDLYEAFLIKQDVFRARDLHTELITLMQAMFIETNPIPVKEALHRMGMVDREYRLPLCPMSEKNQEALAGILADYGLISRNT
jgi:4-hydroxy-tetrahydrodipicolinate synthase